MGYQFSLPLVLRWRASRAEAPLKNWERAIEKKVKFWLIRMHQIKILYIFEVIFGEIYVFGKIKWRFQQK